MCAWFEAFVPTAIGLLSFIIFCENTDKDTAYFKENFWFGLFISIAIFLVLGIINYSVAKSKITPLSLKANELALIHLTGPRNIVEIAQKSVWGRYLKSIIHFPLHWNIEVKKGDENRFHTGINIIVNSDVRLYVPITFIFIFSGPFVAEDLRSKFMGECILDYVDVENYLLETFKDLNLTGEIFRKITQDAKSYHDENISKREFINCIQHAIKFPKPFSNVADISFDIGKPRFNYSTILNSETEV